MRYAGLIKDDFTAAPGVCTSVFLQGCPHRCPGCFNAEAWDFNYGKKFDDSTIDWSQALECYVVPYDETDCIDLSLEGDYIIAEKVGECPNCEAEYTWSEEYGYKESFDLTLI